MSLPISAIVPVPSSTAAVEPIQATADKLVTGSGAQTVANAFSDSSGQFHVGIWTGEVGTLRVSYSENELCVILEGRVILRDAAGAPASFAAGDAFVIPAGFTGTWETVEPCRKIYAIFESAG